VGGAELGWGALEEKGMAWDEWEKECGLALIVVDDMGRGYEHPSLVLSVKGQGDAFSLLSSWG
jgi:hypothetical protein